MLVERDLADGTVPQEWERVSAALFPAHIGHGIREAFYTDESMTAYLYVCGCRQECTCTQAERDAAGV